MNTDLYIAVPEDKVYDALKKYPNLRAPYDDEIDANGYIHFVIPVNKTAYILFDYIQVNRARSVVSLLKDPDRFEMLSLIIRIRRSNDLRTKEGYDPRSEKAIPLVRTLLMVRYGREPVKKDIRSLWELHISNEREADATRGNNNNEMKAGYQLHNNAPGATRAGAAEHHMIDVDVREHELKIDLLINGDPMNNIETRTYIRGHDAENMSDDQILDVITDLEAKIKKYKDMKTVTKTVTNKVTELKDDIKALVEHLDRNICDDADA